MRTYGGDPMRWLDRTPRAIVRAHLRMLPRIEAGESLLTAERVAVGTGSMKGDAGRDLARHWADTARGERQVERPRSAKARRAALASAGVGYHTVQTRKVKVG
jgi:hypothetical protein